MSNTTKKQTSDGSTASYYELPIACTELQDLISYKDMNSQIGEIFRACYRYGEVEHSEKIRDAKKMKFYIEAEIDRLEDIESKTTDEKQSWGLDSINTPIAIPQGSDQD